MVIQRERRTGLGATLASILVGSTLATSALAQQIKIDIAFESRPQRNPQFVPFKYKIIVSKNDGPESARYVDAANWINGVSTIPFLLDPGSKYTFKVATICQDTRNSNALTNSFYAGPITYVTGSLTPGDTTPPRLAINDHSKFVLSGYLSLSGTVSDESHLGNMHLSGENMNGTVTLDRASGTWQGSIALPNAGAHQICLSAKDFYGNTTCITNTYYTDTGVDHDGDGITDFREEHVLGTNPLKRDSDGDTLDDYLEIENGFNPLDVNDALRITFNKLDSTGISFFVNAKPDRLYTLQRSANLTNWENVGTVYSMQLTNSFLMLTDPQVTNGLQYYRAKVMSLYDSSF